MVLLSGALFTKVSFRTGLRNSSYLFLFAQGQFFAKAAN